MSLIKLNNDTYLLRGSPATLIKLVDREAYVVDPGSTGERGLEIMELLNRKFNAVKVIALITHHHSDHIYALTTLRTNEIYVPYGEELLISCRGFRVFLDYGIDLTSVNNKTSTAPDISLENIRLVRDGEEIHGFKVIDLKGHSYGHVGYALDDEVLYVGDALFGDKLLEGVKVPYLNDVRLFTESLNKIKEIVMRDNYRYVVLSHGPLVSNLNDLTKLINLNLTYLERVRMLAITTLKDFKTLEQLTSAIMKELGIKESAPSYLLTHTTIRAVVNELIRRGEVTAVVNESQLMFRAVG